MIAEAPLGSVLPGASTVYAVSTLPGTGSLARVGVGGRTTATIVAAESVVRLLISVSGPGCEDSIGRRWLLTAGRGAARPEVAQGSG